MTRRRVQSNCHSQRHHHKRTMLRPHPRQSIRSITYDSPRSSRIHANTCRHHISTRIHTRDRHPPRHAILTRHQVQNSRELSRQHRNHRMQSIISSNQSRYQTSRRRRRYQRRLQINHVNRRLNRLFRDTSLSRHTRRSRRPSRRRRHLPLSILRRLTEPNQKSRSRSSHPSRHSRQKQSPDLPLRRRTSRSSSRRST